MSRFLVKMSWAIVFFSQTIWMSASYASPKALVIGIKDYSYWSRLQNSRNDAEDMAKTLTDMGFETTLVVRDAQGEVNSQRFTDALNQFANRLQANDNVLFFYSGHGAAIPNDNGSMDGYLIPSNTPTVTRNNKQAIKDSAIALKNISETLSNRIDPDTGSLLFLIDACRNEVVNKGADVVEESTPSQPLSKQVEVIYATSNGSTSLDKLPTDTDARNGVFTRIAIDELNRHKNTQGYSSDAFFPAVKTKALQVARAAGKLQVPAWMNDTGKESFVFVPCPVGQPCVVVVNQPPASITANPDKQFWDEIKTSTDANDYAAYLKQYPQGAFVALAESRRDKYTNQASSSSAILDSLRIDTKAKKAMTAEEMIAERERNPQGTSIYESLSLKNTSAEKNPRVAALRLPNYDNKSPDPSSFGGCNNLVLDLNQGTLNGLVPTVSQAQVKQYLPCATGDTEDGEVYNYGGGVFFLDHDFFMYTGKDFIEVRQDFKGNVTDNMMSKSKAEIIARYGIATIDNGYKLFFNRQYGCLRFTFNGTSVKEIGVYSASCEQASQIK